MKAIDTNDFSPPESASTGYNFLRGIRALIVTPPSNGDFSFSNTSHASPPPVISLKDVLKLSPMLL